MSEFRFQVGQWVRISEPREPNGTGRVGGTDDYSVRVGFPALGDGKLYSYFRSEVEPWTPREGDRVRITSCDQFPKSVGFVGIYQNSGLEYVRVMEGKTNGWQMPVGGAEFEPVFDKPDDSQCADTDEADKLAPNEAIVPKGSVIVNGVRREISDAPIPNELLAPTSFAGVKFPPAGHVVRIKRPTFAEPNPANYTGCHLPLGVKRARGLESAKAILGSEWKGRQR